MFTVSRRQWEPRDLEHPPGTQSSDERRTRWLVFRWNYIGRLMEQLDALPSPSHNDWARALSRRLERLRKLE